MRRLHEFRTAIGSTSIESAVESTGLVRTEDVAFVSLLFRQQAEISIRCFRRP